MHRRTELWQKLHIYCSNGCIQSYITPEHSKMHKTSHTHTTTNDLSTRHVSIAIDIKIHSC